MRVKQWVCAFLVLALAVTLLPARSFAAETGPALAAGNHENWIDRIAQLPDYARRFYGWLEENATATGALADPAKATKIGNAYVHRVHTLKGTAEFSYSAGSNMDELAKNAALEHVGDAPSIVMDYIFDVYGAFDRDHPEVFWLGTESTCGMGINYTYTSNNGTAEVKYELSVYFYLKSGDYDVRIKPYRDPTLIADGIQKRDRDIQRILSECPTGESVERQIRYLNKVLTETNAYNSAIAVGDSASADATAWKCVSALAGSTGTQGPVCEGYARAFKVLCDRLGIPCVINEGYARNSASAAPEAHMWNYVKVEGGWYAVDVTWNDPVLKSDINAAISGKEREKWLLLGSDSQISDGLSFLESHPIRNEVNSGGMRYDNGPVLERDAYATEIVPDNLLDVSAYRKGAVYTAPEKEGYVFAGWFEDEGLTRPLGENVTTGYAYARFVDADVLTVKLQLTQGTTLSSPKADLRLLTGTNTLNYQYVYFMVSSGGKTRRVISNEAYEQLLANGQRIGSAAEVFGGDAVCFMAYTLTDIPCESFENQITITPGWCTLDGTCVTGTARTVRVSDGC